MITSKHILSALKQLGFLVLALLAFTIFINLSWFDEELHPQLEILKIPQPVSPENNAYPLVWGLQAANDKDPFQEGKAIMQRQRELYESGDKIVITDEELLDIYNGSDLDKAWQAELQSLSCVTRLSLDCADKLVEEIKEKGVNDSRLQVGFVRYENILKTEIFRESQEADEYTNLPPYGLLMTISRVYLSDKALTTPPTQFIELLDKDWHLWKTMLRDGEYLIAKMVALAGLRNDIQLVSYLIRDNYFSKEDLNQLQQVLTNLSEIERDIGETFDAEMRLNILSHNANSDLYGNPSWVQQLFWQENATLNDTYLKVFAPVHLLSSLSPAEFYQRKGNTKQPFKVRVFPPDLYNLGGKLAVKETLGSFSIQDYITRANDAVGQINALKLQIELALNEDQPVQAIINGSQYKNPFTLEPLQYRAQDNTVGYDCLSPGQTDVCRVRL